MRASLARSETASAGAESPGVSPWRRLAAFAVDYVALGVYIGLLWLTAYLLGRAGFFQEVEMTPGRGQALGLVTLTIPVILYFALWDSSRKEATPGKRLLGLRVVSMDRSRLPLGRSLVRSALKFAPWEAAHFVLWRIPGWPGEVAELPVPTTVGFVAVWLIVALYLILLWRDPLGRTPYDHASGSRVVPAG